MNGLFVFFIYHLKVIVRQPNLSRWLHKIFRFTQIAMMKAVASVN